jgi:hypothetical protein
VMPGFGVSATPLMHPRGVFWAIPTIEGAIGATLAIGLSLG